MNGFEKHKLNHTSASQINMYANCAGAWCAKYLFGAKFTFGNAARAGVLVEDAIVNILARDMPIEDAISRAKGDYNKSIAIGAKPSDIKRGEAIEGMIRNAIEELKPLGKPDFAINKVTGIISQIAIELNCNGDGWRLPIIGYVDFIYPDLNLIVDLKTTMKMPSEMSVEHYRQGAIYKKATGFDVRFLYVTGKKTAWHDIGEIDHTLSEIKSILNRQEKMLRLDSVDIKEFVPVNKGSYYWSDDFEVAKELYGI